MKGPRLWITPSHPNWDERERTVQSRPARVLEKQVQRIVTQIRAKGDSALIKYTSKFDKVALPPERLRVTTGEAREAYGKVSHEEISAIKSMKQRLEIIGNEVLDRAEFQVELDGVLVRNLLKPIESVGCYVPGGEAVYPSTMAMTVVPAKLAGVPRVVVCSPPTAEGTINPLTLVAADICEADEVYKVGGAQAIAALAYGTRSIKPVRKIVGPGNKYVTMAKMLVSKDVPIDMPAGPSEILILADETADPRLIALDMISQAEHAADSVVGLMTTSKELAEAVLTTLREIAPSMKRARIVRKALSENSFIVVCKTTDEMIQLANEFASEHVEIMAKESEQIADKMMTAGLVLVGRDTPVSASDYCFGTNHVLPTSGFGYTFSGLSVLDFARRISIVESSKEALLQLKDVARTLANAENLPNHYKAIEGRFSLE